MASRVTVQVEFLVEEDHSLEELETYSRQMTAKLGSVVQHHVAEHGDFSTDTVSFENISITNLGFRRDIVETEPVGETEVGEEKTA